MNTAIQTRSGVKAGRYSFGAQSVSVKRTESNALATIFFVCGAVHIATLLRTRAPQRLSWSQLAKRRFNQWLTGVFKAMVLF